MGRDRWEDSLAFRLSSSARPSQVRRVLWVMGPVGQLADDLLPLLVPSSITGREMYDKLVSAISRIE